eukprot:545400-Alexandrium_andersonii.AAC.1
MSGRVLRARSGRARWDTLPIARLPAVGGASMSWQRGCRIAGGASTSQRRAWLPPPRRLSP